MVSKEEFIEWLNKDTAQPFKISGKYPAEIYIKIPKTENLWYLYHQRSYDVEEIEKEYAFKYTGIYNKTDGLIYDSRHTFPDCFSDIEYPEDIEGMEIKIKGQVRETVERYINNDRSRLRINRLSREKQQDLENYKSFYLSKRVKKFFVQDVKSEDIHYKCNYELGIWTDKNLLDYISDPKGFIKRETERFLETDQEKILLECEKNDLLKSELEALKELADSPLHRLRNIIKAMANIPARTVNVTINKAGQEFTVKINASILRTAPYNNYPLWGMSSEDREKFKELFGPNAEYNPEDIIAITYCRKPIYTAEVYAPEPTETEGIKQTMTQRM